MLAIACVGRAASAEPDAGSTPAAAETPLTTAFVIPAGEESRLADVLGSGQELAGGCRFSGGQVESSLVHATYKCPGGEVVVDLRHPEAAPADAVRTENFAVTVASGSPPPGFSEALLARIREREGEFAWKQVGGGPDRRFGAVLPIAIGLVIVAILVWVVYRVRRRPPADS
jgi:hypothetical protein